MLTIKWVQSHETFISRVCVGGGDGGGGVSQLTMRKYFLGFPGGAVVKNLPCNAGDLGSIPSPERSLVPWGNGGQAQQLRSLPALDRMLRSKRSHCKEKPEHRK